MEISHSRASAKNHGVLPTSTAKIPRRCAKFCSSRQLRFVLTTRTASHLQTVLDPKTSRRIFELARDQQDELDLPDADADDDVIEDDFTRPRTHLERIDEDEDEEEEFQGFSDDERELVRRRLR
jgi:hypothetical protein